MSSGGIIEQCWLYEGYLKDGYGRSGGVGVHRLAYEAIRGPIQAGMTIDHLCRVRHCYNPFHMEIVSMSENLRRRPRVTHCVHGHEYTEANTYWWNGWRYCRRCNHER